MDGRALTEHRADALRLEVNLIPRLEAFAARQSPDWHTDETQGERTGLRKRISQTVRRLTGVFRAAAFVPAMLRQALAVSRGPTGEGDVLLLSVASNRLPPVPGIGVREYLALLSTEFPHPGASATSEVLATKIRDATRILLVDPVRPSEYWTRFKTCQEEEVIVTDAAFLVVWSALRFARHPITATRKAARVLRESRAAGLRRPLAVHLLTHALKDVCAPYKRTEVVFFTANSTLTEILREQQLRDPRCEQLVEVMHGIGSTDSERFFAAALEGAGERRERHRFVPQLPGLPLYGVLSQDLAGPNGAVAVNTYLNRYLAARTRKGSLEGFVRRELSRFGSAAENALIVVFLGNNTNTGSFRNSVLHRAECAMIQMAAQMLREKGREAILVYVPHPALRDVVFDDPAFIDNDVRIYPDSVFTWLVADASVSIFSSSIFEAAFFCDRAFAPIVPEDDVFTKSYLDMLSYPRDSTVEGIEESYSRFISDAAEESTEDPITKARERLARTGWSWDE